MDGSLPLPQSQGKERTEAHQATKEDPALDPWDWQDRLLFDARCITDLSPITACKGLHTLDISNTGIVDLGPLAACTGLRTLNISGNADVTDLSPLATNGGLRSLGMRSCKSVTDLSPLAACMGLHYLDISNNDVTMFDLSPLAACMSGATHPQYQQHWHFRSRPYRCMHRDAYPRYQLC